MAVQRRGSEQDNRSKDAPSASSLAFGLVLSFLSFRLCFWGCLLVFSIPGLTDGDRCSQLIYQLPAVGCPLDARYFGSAFPFITSSPLMVYGVKSCGPMERDLRRDVF